MDSTWLTTLAVDTFSVMTDSTPDLGAPTINITTSLPKPVRQLYQMDVKILGVSVNPTDCICSTICAKTIISALLVFPKI
jgi:hypothetical protein